MAVRRSARLRSSASLDSMESTPQPEATTQLASVEERDEEPVESQPVMRTPITKKTAQKPSTTHSHQKPKQAQTPTSTSAIRPPLEEMHPSKAHQSTAKKVDSGMILGFNPIKKDADGKVVKDSITENTPSKTKPSPAPTQFGTPGYEFKIGQETQLSAQAKELMDRIREEAKQTRAKMILENPEGEEKQCLGTVGDRKIAKPRGQAGRFSDVHMAEFKKMDSIAGHPSAFRAIPGRFQPVTKSLKRTKSKAQLDEPEPQNVSPSRSSSVKRSAVPTPIATSKRVKHNPAADDNSKTDSEKKKVEKQEVTTPKPTTPKPAGPRPRSVVRASLMTPTRASMARSTSTTLSLKAPKTSLIPSLARSPSTQALASPKTPRTEFNPRFKSNLPTFTHLKSILRKRQPLFSRDPSKIAAGTHVAAPDFNPDLLFGGKQESADAAPSPSPKKHVEFTPSVKSRHALADASPCRSKARVYPTCPDLCDVNYPTLPTLTPDQKATAEESTTPTYSPTQSPTIRHVRKSNAGGSQAATYPELPVVAHGISHGLSNKKRRRDDVDDDDVTNAENTENVPPADAQSDERNTKRLKANPPTPSPVKSRPIKTPVRSVSGRVGTPASATASAKQKRSGVLSLSRLNMLSKPKGRA